MEEQIVKADPLADPAGYQRELLAFVGDADPASIMVATPEEFRTQTARLTDAQLQQAPEPGEWSVAELLAHFFDDEIAFAFRARLVLSQDDPELIGFDQDAWATLPHPPFAELLDAFAALRTANLVLMRGASDADWERSGVHSERGRLTFRVLAQEIAGHDRAHLEQLRQTVAAVRA